MARDKSIYRETYEAGAIVMEKKHLPVVKHITKGDQKFSVVGCEMLAAGIIERDGKRLEYQDMRIFYEVES